MKQEKFKTWLIKYTKWIILFISLLGFIMLARVAYNQEIMHSDILNTNFISDNNTKIALFITNFGSATILILISVVLLLAIKDKKIGLLIYLNLAIEASLNALLKNIIQRPRPEEINLINETGYSFPSGHSMASMTFYGFLIYLICKYVKNKKIKWTLIVLLSILIVSIGLSRIYLGVHYTSDVIGAFLISISYLIIYTDLINKFILKTNE